MDRRRKSLGMWSGDCWERFDGFYRIVYCSLMPRARIFSWCVYASRRRLLLAFFFRAEGVDVPYPQIDPKRLNNLPIDISDTSTTSNRV